MSQTKQKTRSRTHTTNTNVQKNEATTQQVTGDPYNLFMQAPVAIAILKGPQHVYEFSNALTNKILKVNNPIGKSIQELFPDNNEIITMLDTIYKTGQPFTVSEYPINIDNPENDSKTQTIYVNATYQPLRDDNNNVIGIMTTGVDVTEHVLARKRAEKSEARLRAIIEATPECIKIVKEDGTLDYMNASGLTLIEGNQDIVGKACVYDVVAPEYKKEWIANHKKVISGKRLNWQFDIIGLKGTRHRMETHAVPLKDQNGTISQLAVTRDITEEFQTHEALKESEMRFRNLADTAPMYIAMADEKGNAVYFNKPWLKYTGCKLSDMKGLGWLKVLHPDDAPKFEKDFKHAFKKQLPINNNYRFRRADGQFRWMLAVGAPRFTPEGKFIGYFGTYTDFHDLKEAQLAVQASEEKYKTLISSIDEGFCVAEIIYDKKDNPIDYRFLEINKIFEQQTGLKNALGKRARELVPKLESEWINKYAQVAKTGRSIRFELQSPAMKRWFSVYASRVGEKDENKVAIVFTDITERKNDAALLKQSEERFRTLIEKSTDAIQLVTAEGKILYSSDSIKNVLGYSPEEFIGKEVLPHLHPDDTAYFLKEFSKLLKNPGGQISLEYRVRHKNGSWAWLEVTGVNHLKTPYINALVGTFRNITDRKKAEEQLIYQKSLLESQLEASPLGILVVTPGGKIAMYNSEFAHLWHFPHKVLDSQIDELALNAAKKMLVDPSSFIKTVKKSYENKESNHEILRFKDGRVYERFGAPINDENTQYHGYIWFFLNITDREKLSQQKDDFIGIATHELKTPVTSIKAYTQILHDRFSKAGDLKSATLLGKMDAQLDKLISLISDLLDVTKIEGGKLSFNLESFDFTHLVQELIEELQRTTTKHTIHLSGNVSKKVYADKDRTGQVLTNLVTNAIKYSPHSDSIEVILSEDKDSITLCVKDYGVGIPDDKKDKVFERFYRVSGPRQDTFPGLGLGLYISSEIIKRQGGRIWVESKKGKGSTFCFTLPIKPRKIKQQENTLVEYELQHE